MNLYVRTRMMKIVELSHPHAYGMKWLKERVKRSGPGILIIELFEYTFLAFEDATLRAAPRVWQILEWDTRWDSPFLVPIGGIVGIVAFKTYPAGVFYHLLCHRGTSSFHFYPSTLSYMKSLVGTVLAESPILKYS